MNCVYHLEERPLDNGRCVIVDTKAQNDVLPSPYSARDSVQEYGGAPAIVYDGIIYFSNDSDNGIYAINLKATPAVVRLITDPGNISHSVTRRLLNAIVDSQSQLAICQLCGAPHGNSLVGHGS